MLSECQSPCCAMSGTCCGCCKRRSKLCPTQTPIALSTSAVSVGLLFASVVASMAFASTTPMPSTPRCEQLTFAPVTPRHFPRQSRTFCIQPAPSLDNPPLPPPPHREPLTAYSRSIEWLTSTLPFLQSIQLDYRK